MNDISELQYDNVIFGDDLNVELDDKGDACKHLQSFIHDLQLIFVDDKISSNESTYRVVSTAIYGACSTIDHFAISRSISQHIHDVKIIDSGDNFSDHCPLILEVDVVFFIGLQFLPKVRSPAVVQ